MGSTLQSILAFLYVRPTQSVDFGAFMLAGYPSGICETHQLKWARPKIWVKKPQVGASMKPPHAASHAFPSVFAMWIWVFHTQTAADSTTVANRRLDADTCTLAESHRSRSRRYTCRPLLSSLERTALCCKTLQNLPCRWIRNSPRVV